MVNRIFLIGYLGRDVDMSYTQQGTALAKFTLGVSRPQRTNKETGERGQEETDWFYIVAWDRLAEICNTYLHKGSKVFIEGRMQSRKYTDKNGLERTSWDVIANDMRMLDPKNAQAGPAPARAGASGGGYAGDGDAGPEDIPF